MDTYELSDRDESDTETNSVVSDISEDIDIPEKHLLCDYIAPKQGDLSHGSLIWLINEESFPKRSYNQWYRFLLYGNRMKTTDPIFLALAYKLKSALWYASGFDYGVYDYTYVWTTLRMMNKLQMFTKLLYIEN